MKNAILLLAFLAGANAMCPNLCSGHGHCEANDLCTCFGNWQGNDCSGRTCPFSNAWVIGDRGTTFTDYDLELATSGNEAIPGAHGYAECSNKGSCDRKVGTCKCNAGYEGKACRRSTCPNACSGHGTCEYIQELVGSTYVDWDALKIQGCKCDPGYQGHDCSSRMCPKGDDPLTTTSSNEVQLITIKESNTAVQTGQFTLSYTDLYGATWTTWPLSAKVTGTTLTAAASAKQVEEALEALPNRVIEDLTVTQGAAATDKGVTYSVSFLDSTNSGTQNLITVNTAGCSTAGCQPLYSGVTVSGTATVTVARSSSATSEAYECSKRGDCDSKEGLCTCHSGYVGPACATQTSMI